MKKLAFVTTLFLVLFPFLSSGLVYASGTISLNPTSGVIGPEGKSIDVVVDTGGGEINGIELFLVYDGTVDFTGFDSGNISGCTVDGIEREDTEEFDEDVFLYCFILSEPYTGSNGIFATLNFEPTAEGQATVEIIGVEAAGNIEIGDGVGNYTTTLQVEEEEVEEEEEEVQEEEAPREEDEKRSLPRTSIFNTVGITVGVILLCMPLVLNSRFPKRRDLMIGKIK